MVNDLVAARMKNMRSTDHWVLDGACHCFLLSSKAGLWNACSPIDPHPPFPGFPRTREQAQFLQTLTKPTAVINVDVPFDTIVQRLQERLVHPASGRIYNLSFNPPKEAVKHESALQREITAFTPLSFSSIFLQGKDDVTGEPLVQRDDDKVKEEEEFGSAGLRKSQLTTLLTTNLPFIPTQPEVVQDRLEAYRMLTEPVIDFYNQLGLVQTFSVRRRERMKFFLPWALGHLPANAPFFSSSIQTGHGDECDLSAHPQLPFQLSSTAAEAKGRWRLSVNLLLRTVIAVPAPHYKAALHCFLNSRFHSGLIGPQHPRVALVTFATRHYHSLTYFFLEHTKCRQRIELYEANDSTCTSAIKKNFKDELLLATSPLPLPDHQEAKTRTDKAPRKATDNTAVWA